MLPIRTALVAAVAASALGISLAGCTVSVDDKTASRPDPVARAAVLNDLVQRAAAQDGVWPEKSLSDLLPRHRFSLDGSAAAPLAEGIVVGTITDAQPGRGYMIVGDDAVSGTEIPFDDQRALWRVVVLTVKADTRLGDVEGKSVKVGVVVDGGLDTEEAIAGYLGLGRVALVLNAPGKYEFDPSLYSVRESGSLFGLVSKKGAISFPALGTENAEFVGALDTVGEVVDQSTDAAPVVEVTNDGGDLQRSDDR